jgi:uncharacterized membrane protein YqiK
MDVMTWLIFGSVTVVVIAGAFVAAWWWKLVSKVAPYRDELEKAEARRRAAGEDDNVVVISNPGSPRRDER